MNHQRRRLEKAGKVALAAFAAEEAHLATIEPHQRHHDPEALRLERARIDAIVNCERLIHTTGMGLPWIWNAGGVTIVESDAEVLGWLARDRRYLGTHFGVLQVGGAFSQFTDSAKLREVADWASKLADHMDATPRDDVLDMWGRPKSVDDDEVDDA